MPKVVSLLLTDLNDSRKCIAAKASIIVFETTSLTQFYSPFPQSLRGQRSNFGTNLSVWETAYYPSHNSTLILPPPLGKNVGLGEGQVGSFPET